jgi:hypothetical protein
MDKSFKPQAVSFKQRPKANKQMCYWENVQIGYHVCQY